MPESIKILHIDTDRTWRGGQQQVYSLIKNLRQMGCINHIASPPHSELLQRTPHDFCTPHRISMRNEWDLISALRLAYVIRRQRIDVVHAHSGRGHTLGVLAKWLTRSRVPLVVSRRVDFNIRDSFVNRWKYKSADFYLPISRAIAAILHEAGVERKRMEIVFSSVDEDRFAEANGSKIREEFSIETDAPIVGSVAVMEDRKCQPCILDAARIVLRDYPNARFILVGAGPLFDDIKKRAQELHLEERVILPGFRKDVPDFLDAFDIFLLVPKLEGLGSSILDAQYFSLPVVATPVGGVPEIVVDGETGVLVPVNDSQKLAEAIVDLLKNPDTMRRLGDAGKRQIEERFTAKIMAQRTTEVYTKLLQLNEP